MEFSHQEQVVIDLLAKLKNASPGYPKRMLASRREVFLDQIAHIGLNAGLGVETGDVKTPKGRSGGSHFPPINASSIFEMLLVAAIIIESGIAAYNYRHEIAKLFASDPAILSITETTSQPASESPQPDAAPDINATATETPTVTATATVTNTPTVTTTATSGQTSDSGKVSVTGTPDPKDNNGNHLGQTKNPPSSTKENKNPTKSQKKQ